MRTVFAFRVILEPILRASGAKNYPGALQYQMDTGVRLTLPKAGAFGENTVPKNEGSLCETPNSGSKLWGTG